MLAVEIKSRRLTGTHASCGRNEFYQVSEERLGFVWRHYWPQRSDFWLQVSHGAWTRTLVIEFVTMSRGLSLL